MTTSRWARRCSPAATTATSTPSAAASVASAVRSASVLDTGHGELDRRHRVLGQPEDPVDVAAGRGDPRGDGGGRLGGQRVPEHGHMGTARPRGRLSPSAGDDLGLHLHGLGPAVDGGPQLALERRRRRRGHQRAQHDPAAGDDLLDVDDVDGVGGEGVEEPGGDARPVLPEDLDEKGGDVRRVCEALMVFPPYPAPSAYRHAVRLTDREQYVAAEVPVILYLTSRSAPPLGRAGRRRWGRRRWR